MGRSAASVFLIGHSLVGDRDLRRLLDGCEGLITLQGAERASDSEAVHDAEQGGVVVMEASTGQPSSVIVRRVRHWIEGREDRVVVLVHDGLHEADLANALAHGVTDCFVIPYDPELLADRIRGLMAMLRRRSAN